MYLHEATFHIFVRPSLEHVAFPAVYLFGWCTKELDLAGYAVLLQSSPSSDGSSNPAHTNKIMTACVTQVGQRVHW
jgi:hypothetical protein